MPLKLDVEYGSGDGDSGVGVVPGCAKLIGERRRCEDSSTAAAAPSAASLRTSGWIDNRFRSAIHCVR